MSRGIIFNTQHFSVHDGPGIRTTVFFKGCSLRCFWCHNPESFGFRPQIKFEALRCIGYGACADACPQGNPAEVLGLRQTAWPAGNVPRLALPKP